MFMGVLIILMDNLHTVGHSDRGTLSPSAPGYIHGCLYEYLYCYLQTSFYISVKCICKI